jgi:hypothetical protein
MATNGNRSKDLDLKKKLLKAQSSKIVVVMCAQMACLQIENKLLGMKFPVHGIANHVLLMQRGAGLVKPKLALFVGAFYNRTLAWLPRVIERTSLGMKLNPRVF